MSEVELQEPLYLEDVIHVTGSVPSNLSAHLWHHVCEAGGQYDPATIASQAGEDRT